MMSHHAPQSDWPPLLILGASTRAAAGSAVRAGFLPICADRFQDVDLHRLAHVLPVDNYPRGLLAAVESLPPTPWLYTGAIENEPKLIAAIMRRHPLLGNPPDVLRRIRDPFWLEQVLQAHEFPTLKHRGKNDPPPADGTWLIKPRRSGGGAGIRAWDGERRGAERGTYFQERRDGRPISALFIASDDGVQLIGLCEQLIGHAAGAPTSFAYAGSIGPIDVSAATSETIQRIGALLVSEAGLCGLFGCDFMLTDDTPWLVEVNPRYTASVEVLEHATGWHALRNLLAPRQQSRVPLDSRAVTLRSTSNGDQHPCRGASGLRQPTTSCVGKQIVYAVTDLIAPSLEQLLAAEPNDSPMRPLDDEPLLADIPIPNSPIAAGWPICTVFARAETVSACRDLLELRASVVRKWTK